MRLTDRWIVAGSFDLPLKAGSSKGVKRTISSLSMKVHVDHGGAQMERTLSSLSTKVHVDKEDYQNDPVVEYRPKSSEWKEDK